MDEIVAMLVPDCDCVANNKDCDCVYFIDLPQIPKKGWVIESDGTLFTHDGSIHNGMHLFYEGIIDG